MNTKLKALLLTLLVIFIMGLFSIFPNVIGPIFLGLLGVIFTLIIYNIILDILEPRDNEED